jgi:hypothetical protein
MVRAYCAIAQAGGSTGRSETGGPGRAEQQYKAFYPIGDDANILFETKYYKNEAIIFEANPIVRFSFYNNFQRRLLSTNNAVNTASAFYAVFKPQLRMYSANSLPVKMPSYKIQLGFQQLYRVRKNDFLTVAVESGHYSNGQAGCAFSEQFADGSPQCDSVYETITPKTNLSSILNRTNGNFSTDLTEIIINYRLNNKIINARPTVIHSVTAGLNIYHDKFLFIGDFGGYSDNDIKIYGRLRYSFGYALTLVCKGANPAHFTFSENMEFIHGAHPWVDPFRTVTTAAYYPFGRFDEFGVCVRFVHGHDDYNYRFVDSGNQIGFGFTWTPFTPFQITKRN